MANFYCDHGAYAAYTPTPTWAIPQDGDGLAIAPSIASATAQIVFTGIPAGAISVCGIVASPTWATNADTCANNLATWINGASATGFVTTPGWDAARVQLRDAVYARGPALGAPAGTCQIMTRQGSAVFNGNTAFAHSLTNVNSAASSLTFSGGVSGCWGYAALNTTIWPSAKGVWGYGVFTVAPPFANTYIPGSDTIYIKAGLNLVITNSGPSNTFSIGKWTGSSISALTRIIIDDGSVWPTGNVGATVTFNNIYAAQLLAGSSEGFSHAVIIEAPILPSSQRGLSFVWNSPSYGCGIGPAPGSRYKNIEFVSTDTSRGFYLNSVNNTFGVNGLCIFENILLSTKSIDPLFTPFGTIAGGASGYSRAYITFLGGEVATRITTGHPGVFAGAYAIQDFAARVTLIGVKFSGFTGASKLFNGNEFGTDSAIFFKDCDLSGIAVLSLGMAGRAPGSGSAKYKSALDGVYGSNQHGNQDFWIENNLGLVEWASNRSFPVCSAKLLDGVTGWSIHMLPSTNPSRLGPSASLDTPRIAKYNSLADGVRTLRVELAIHEDLTWTAADVSLLIEYVDTAGNVVLENSWDYSKAALQTSSTEWSNESGGQVVFSDGVTQYFNKYHLTMTTNNPIKQGTAIAVYVRVHSTVALATHGLFVDPEILVQ